MGDIEDAKRRVREMQEKASSYVNNSEEHEASSDFKKENYDVKNNKPENANGKSDEAPQEKKDDSSIIILILLLLLSHEGADHKLLLALLYLLL